MPKGVQGIVIVIIITNINIMIIYYSETSFSLLMSNITLIPVFGSSFIVYVPILIIFVAFISLFNCMSRLLRFVGVESDDAYSYYKCCSSKSKMSEDDQNIYESGKKLVSSAIRLMARGKEETISPAHDIGRNTTKLREQYETINRGNDNDFEDDEVSIELSNLQRLEGGIKPSKQQSSNFFSGINNTFSLSYNYEKIEKNSNNDHNVNPVHNSSNPVHNSSDRNKDFSFEEDDDTSRYTGRYG